MEIYCLVSIDSKFINVKGQGTCDVNFSCHSNFFYVKDTWKHSDVNPPTVVTFCMLSTPTVYIVLACMVIQFFIYFIEYVNLLHLSTAGLVVPHSALTEYLPVTNFSGSCLFNYFVDYCFDLVDLTVSLPFKRNLRKLIQNGSQIRNQGCSGSKMY